MSRLTARLVATFLSAIALVSCDAQSAGGQSTTGTLDLTYSGQIDERSVEDMLALITPNTDRLVITSTGGEILPALRLGRAVRETGLTVVVRGYCLSACAHFIFAPAQEKLVEPDGIVGFHGTASAREELLERASRPDLAAFFADAADAEQAFYAEAGLSRELLLQPLREVSPLCFAELAPSPASADDVAVVTRANFFIPTRASLQQWRVDEIVGYWPEDEASFIAALKALPSNFSMQFRLEALHGSFSNEFPTISVCTAQG